MWKAFVFWSCAAGYMAIISCNGETNPTGETKLIKETEPDGTSLDGSRLCGCHPPICPKNEVYYNCSGGCIPRRCSEIGFPLICDKKCTPGCVCKDNNVRADNGTCIPIPDCPSCGGDKNAQQGCGNHCGRTCSTYNKPPRPCPLFCIFNGCNCRPGFVYDNNIKACVKPKDCTPICQANEEYSPCTNSGCEAKNCSQIGKPVPCIRLDPKYCIKGCTCVKGYLRHSNGTCVPKDQCTPKCDKPHEVYDVCPAPCPPKRCNVNEAVIKCAAPPKPGDPDCKPGCRCADKYYRNATGTCVPKKKCEKPLICDRPNEVYDACPAICPAQECGVNLALILCQRPPEYGDPACKPSCVCIDGHVRNGHKECIPRDKCPQNCPANEEYSTCINGGCDARNCSQVGKPVPCVKLDPKSCIKGCVCVKGYLRTSNGTCVPKEQCTPKCDKPHEVYDVCPAPCPPKRCNVNEAVIKCAAPPKPGDPDCKPGCRCADKYYRNATGTCVPKKKCEKPLICDRPNEVYDACPALCPAQECGVNLALILCQRPPEYGDPACKPSCVCIDGHVRNGHKECIPRDKCPQNCPANEEYSTCINGGCDARNCSQVGKPVPCVKLDPKSCIKGCVCVKGYLRTSNGTCVPKEQCTPKCDKPNEVYDVCPAPCPPKRCNVNEAVIKCAAPPKPGDPDCKPGCRCADKYYRNATGTCVLKKKCEKPLICDRPNEVYDACPAICPAQECGVNLALIRCQRPPEYGDPACKPSCVCIDGHVRNGHKECIPRDKCPKPCGKNEYWEPCITGCGNQSCTVVGRPHNSCPGQTVGQCPLGSGCRCKPKHYRNSDGVCVPESECPRCYGKNEVWVNCIQGCSNQSCDDIGKIFNCPNKPAGYCKSGCRCVTGTWRNASNVCVPQEECPTPDCPTGEIWSRCPTVKCDGDYCPKTKDSPQTCPVGIVCDKPRCVCEINKKRDWNTGKCIPTQDCPKFKCGCNEEYQACPWPCPGDTCFDYITGKHKRCPLYKYIVCRPQCRCRSPYFRDANGTCIPGEDCRMDTSVTTTKPPTTTVTSSSGGGTGLTGLLDGITAFTGLCLYNRIKSAPSENIIMSAMSLFTPIAELCLYSEGSAYDQCIKILNLKNKQDIRDTFPKLDASYGDQTTINFTVANNMYFNQGYKLSDSLKKDAVGVFNASIEELNFSQNKLAADIINAWVESKTNNRIQNLVTQDMFSALTRLVLVNAIYFKGTWLYEFNKNNTKEEDFYLNDGTTKKTRMMGQEIKDLDFGEIPSLDCKAVRVYYKGKTSSMIIVLPNSINGTLDLAKNLKNPTNWKKITDSLSPQKVKLYLPLFKITTTTDLKDLLKEVNITDWFNCENSGLEGLLDKRDNLCITEAIQKAFVEVNEEGVEAAAANAVVVTTRSLPLPPPVIKEFIANRAFLYYLEVGPVVTLCGAFNG